MQPSAGLHPTSADHLQAVEAEEGEEHSDSHSLQVDPLLMVEVVVEVGHPSSQTEL